MDYSAFCQKDVTLRDYQQLAKENIFRQWNHADDILYQMPTGTGKTRLFTSIIRDINVWGLNHNHRFRILIIAHRSELIEQCSQSLSRYHIQHGVLAGTLKDKRDLTQLIQVASIQTITHPSNRHLLEDLSFDFIIIDEAHHAVANSYKRLWTHCPLSKKLGVTATPWRMNNGGFRSVFESYIPSMPIKTFIQQGWLAAYKYYSLPSNSKVHKVVDSIKEFDIEGDYKTSALVEVMDTPRIRAQLFQSYQKYAWGKKGIIYSISRLHSEHICSQYRSHGVRIENIDSETPALVREKLIRDFKMGELDVIVNVDIFSEGFDCPDIEFIQLARPTKSLVKYLQQVGRGLRRNGDKQCVILDNVGMYCRFGLPDEDRDWEASFMGDSCPHDRVQTAPSNRNGERDLMDIDMSEGNEQMVLIREAKQVTSLFSIESPPIPEGVNKEHESVVVSRKPFLISSKTFCAGRFRIEENEIGLYLCNARNGRKAFLMATHTYPGGIIVVNKDKDTDSFLIKKTYPMQDRLMRKTVIIGYIKKDGLLLRFTSFDKSIVNLNVHV